MRPVLPRRGVAAIIAILALAALTACAYDLAVSAAPLLNVSTSGGAVVHVCKDASSPAGVYNFTVSQNGGRGGNLLAGSSFTLNSGACLDVWQALPNPPSADTLVTVTVDEVNIPSDIRLDSVVADAPTTPVYSDTGVAVQVNYYHGASITFFNSSAVCTDQTALNAGGPLPCLYGKTFSIGPSSMEGHLKIPPNSWFNGGYSFKFKSNTHAATQFTVQARVEVPVTCPYGGGPGGSILIPLGTVVYNVPAGNTDWLPTGDANSILSWMGAVRAPDLCGGFPMDNAKGAIFTATVAQIPATGSLVDFRFKYRDPLAKGKVDTNCTDPNAPKRNDAATCGASWSQTVTDP